MPGGSHAGRFQAAIRAAKHVPLRDPLKELALAAMIANVEEGQKRKLNATEQLQSSHL